MTSVLSNVQRELRLLLDDDQWHDRSDVMAAVRLAGGARRHLVLAIAHLREEGFHVDVEQRRPWKYRHNVSGDVIDESESNAVRSRTLPEMRRRLRAAYGSRVEAAARGRSTAKHDDVIARREMSLTALALEAHESPALVLTECQLSTDEEAAIVARVGQP